MLFENREHAARLLARRLGAYYKNKNPLVLAIPRGAIGMAEIIADVLGGELDVVLVHKLGAPGQPELAIGAIDETGNVFLSGYGLDIDSAYLEAENRRNSKSCESGGRDIHRRAGLSTHTTVSSSWWTMASPPAQP